MRPTPSGAICVYPGWRGGVGSQHPHGQAPWRQGLHHHQPKNRDYVKSLGADVIIDYNAEDYKSVLRQQEPAGVDLILEALGNGTASRHSPQKTGAALPT